MRICIATGTRTEYGLLKPLIKIIDINLNEIENPDGECKTSSKILEILKTLKLEILGVKPFYDL